MILTEKQIFMLYMIARDSLRIKDKPVTEYPLFSFCWQTRAELVNEISEQQSNELTEVK